MGDIPRFPGGDEDRGGECLKYETCNASSSTSSLIQNGASTSSFSAAATGVSGASLGLTSFKGRFRGMRRGDAPGLGFLRLLMLAAARGGRVDVCCSSRNGSKTKGTPSRSSALYASPSMD